MESLGKISTIFLLEARVLEQMLQYHLPNIQQFIEPISGAVLTVLYPVDANVILNKPLIAIKRVENISRKTEYFECYHRRNDLTKPRLVI